MRTVRYARRALLLGIAVVGLTIALLPQGELESHSVRDLRICVDSVGVPVDLAIARSKLERVMRDHLTRHPMFGRAGYSPQRWTVVEGCPMQPTLLVSGQPHPKNGGAPGLLGRVDSPTGIRAYVFVVSQREIDRMFGRLEFRVAWQELICLGSHCSEEATALYVSPETLAESSGREQSQMLRGVGQAIGLEPTVPLKESTGPQHK
jgi:hypothetical protein